MKNATHRKADGARSAMPKNDLMRSGGFGAAGSTTDTGTPDETYALVSILYHALQGADTYADFLEDAQAAGDDEVAEFVTQVREEEIRRAARAKELLVARLDGSEEDEEDDDRVADSGADAEEEEEE